MCAGAVDRGEALVADERQGGAGGVREPEVGGRREKRLLQDPQAGGRVYNV